MADNRRFACTGSGRITLMLRIGDARRAAHPGQCDHDVCELMRVPYVKRQVECWPPAVVEQELREYGAWSDSELSDHEVNVQRLLWLLAADVVEQVGAHR